MGVNQFSDQAFQALPPELRVQVSEQWQVLAQQLTPSQQQLLTELNVMQSLPKVFASSEFVANACLRDSALLPRLLTTGKLLETVEVDWLQAQLQLALQMVTNDVEFQSILRVFRLQHMVRIAWRDIAGWVELNETLLDLSNLADVCVQAAYARAYEQFAALYGTPIGQDSGQKQVLLILAM